MVGGSKSGKMVGGSSKVVGWSTFGKMLEGVIESGRQSKFGEMVGGSSKVVGWSTKVGGVKIVKKGKRVNLFKND